MSSNFKLIYPGQEPFICYRTSQGLLQYLSTILRVLPLCICQGCVGERKADSAGLAHWLGREAANGLFQPAFQRKGNWGPLVLHLWESLISWGMFQEPLGGGVILELPASSDWEEDQAPCQKPSKLITMVTTPSLKCPSLGHLTYKETDRGDTSLKFFFKVRFTT